MMPPLRALGAALATVIVAGATLVAAPAALADESKSVQVIGQDGRVVDFLVYLDPAVLTSPDADLSSKVVVSGIEVPSEVKPIVESTAPKQAILVLDESGSMRGPRLASAKEAAINYVTGLPDDVEIGLVSFNDNVTVDVPPTLDKKAVIDAIKALKAGQKTSLYDGILGGLDLAEVDKGARLLVLSDGGDTVSAATLGDVRAAATADGVPIDIVALSPTTEHSTLLRSLALPSGGQFLLATDVQGLNQAFEEATGSFGGKVAVTADFPDDVDASGKFAIVTIGVDGKDYTGTTQLPKTDDLSGPGVTAALPAPSGSAPVDQSQVLERASNPIAPWIYALLIGIVVVIAVLAIESYRRQRRSKLRTEQVLWYSNVATTGAPGSRLPEMTASSPLDSLDAWLSTRKFYVGVDTKLDNGGLKINVATWMAIRVMAALVVAVLLSIILRNAVLGLVAGAVVGWLVSGAWLNSKANARRKAFEDELPDFLMLIASSLRAGLSFQQAVDATAAEGPGEVSRQMRRALSEVQMGSTIEQALSRVSERMDNQDLKWAVTALTIQREVGGNLSNILDAAAQTIKSRADLRREVRTLSAEGRLSGWVLAALPIGLFAYMVVVNPTYISFFWTNGIGFILLGFLIVLFILGFIWMRRLARIQV